MNRNAENEAAVLAYYGREASGTKETKALAGLSLKAFQGARQRLVAQGRLVSVNARYRPA